MAEENNGGAVGAAASFVIKARFIIVMFLAAFTLAMFYQAATKMKVDAGFEKSVPLTHPYMTTYRDYKDTFAGTNRVLVALIQQDGEEMFNEDFLDRLKGATDEVFFIKGVDRSRVSSLFTPDVRFIEVVEGGFAGGNVVPADYAPGAEMFERVKGNVIKAGIVGRYVTSDFKGAMITAELLEQDPVTGEKLDYVRVSHDLIDNIRTKFEDEKIKVHIIGFAKVVGSIVDAIKVVALFFLITIVLAGFLLYLYSGSFKLMLLPIICSMTAVIWEFGLLASFGFGIDPMSVLVPFLVFAIGISHGVQMVNSYMELIIQPGADNKSAAETTLAKLMVPASVALVSDTVGFATIYLIEIQTIQEMAITASMGVAVILIINLLLMPILLSYTKISNMEKYERKVQARLGFGTGLWRALSRLTERGPAIVVLVVSAVLLWGGLKVGEDLAIGDTQAGVPELRPSSRYNQDTAAIVENFTLGVDIVQVIVEVPPEACIVYDVMEPINRFTFHMENVKGVQDAISLAEVATIVNAGFSEGTTSFKVLPRNKYTMVQAVSPIETATGLLNSDCSAMPVFVFTQDHKADTLARVIQYVKDYQAEVGLNDAEFETFLGEYRLEQRELSIVEWTAKIAALDEEIAALEGDDKAEDRARKEGERAVISTKLKDAEDPDEHFGTLLGGAYQAWFDKTGQVPMKFRLITGNAGVMAATNEVVESQQTPIVIYVYAAIIALCLIMFAVQFGTTLQTLIMAGLTLAPLTLMLMFIIDWKVMAAIWLAGLILMWVVWRRPIWMSVASTICVVLPLGLVSALGYAVMVVLGIGLKVPTLPVVALGVGIGVDYGIYIFGVMGEYLQKGMPLKEAYYETLLQTGKAVLFTAVTLGVGVATWVFSDLQFQIDMGKMLAYMFIVNMLAAMVVLPALAHFLIPAPEQK